MVETTETARTSDAMFAGVFERGECSFNICILALKHLVCCFDNDVDYFCLFAAVLCPQNFNTRRHPRQGCEYLPLFNFVI
jgi:hypothetical protein